MGVPAKKGVLLARFLIEPQDQPEIIYNENAKGSQSEILQSLYNAIGSYKLFTNDADEEGDQYVYEKEMQRLAVEKFGRYRSTLVEALQCEDYDNKGVIDLTQLKEAISSVDEDLNEDLMDYLLYYVYIRSDSADLMQYKNIIQMLEDAV